MLTIYFFGGGSSAIVSVGVFYVWPKTTRPLPMWPREAKRLDTPGLVPMLRMMELYLRSAIHLHEVAITWFGLQEEKKINSPNGNRTRTLRPCSMQPIATPNKLLRS
jgi:hypothetical protein